MNIEIKAEENTSLEHIPHEFKEFARRAARCFYEPACVVIVDLLVKRHGIQRKDLFSVLDLARKDIQSAMTKLLRDKFIEERTFGATKTQRLLLNYQTLINTMKFKLVRIRTNLERESQQMLGNNATFVCSQCQRKYSDIDYEELIDETMQFMICPHCDVVLDSLVDETAAIANNLKKKFNEQTQVLNSLMQVIDRMRVKSTAFALPEELELEINSAMSEKKKHMNISSAVQNGQGAQKSKSQIKLRIYSQKYDITIVANGARRKQFKSQPEWISHSTVNPTNTHNANDNDDDDDDGEGVEDMNMDGGGDGMDGLSTSDSQHRPTTLSMFLADPGMTNDPDMLEDDEDGDMNDNAARNNSSSSSIRKQQPLRSMKRCNGDSNSNGTSSFKKKKITTSATSTTAGVGEKEATQAKSTSEAVTEFPEGIVFEVDEGDLLDMPPSQEMLDEVGDGDDDDEYEYEDGGDDESDNSHHTYHVGDNVGMVAV